MPATQQPITSATVLETRWGAVATLCLNRPQKLNALTPEMGRALVEGLSRAAEDQSVRAVVIMGAGRAFCAGGDLELLRDVRRRNAMRELEGLLIAGKEICLAIATMDKPVIAAVNGPAAGGGMNLALACDMRIASSEAKFAESFANVGLYPDFGGTYFLPRIVGPALAAELFYTARLLTPEDALRLGIVNRIFSAEEFEEKTRKAAADLAAAPPLALAAVKRTMLGEDRRALEDRLDEEVRMQIRCFESDDCLEALNAFFEKRKPNFRGS
ncbi:MAG TPA: enoyl-CoA hydratase-related protein [Candidatus Acidoferrales bacterium]|nr:enoyl-CoA hydratase-related protein [Candidatus Acidoferrales bacterium]